MSLFQNLYKYQKTDEGNNQQENYLTELLAYVLQHDEAFRQGFFDTFLSNELKLFISENCKSFTLRTQDSYTIPDTKNNTARPDIVIKGFDGEYNINPNNINPNLLIFIENKIGSSEGWRYIIPTDEKQDNTWQSQLTNYSKVLKEAENKGLQTHLIYLTRNFEIPPAKGVIAFKHIFWYQIYQILKNVDENPLSITFQFKQYLINLGMNNDNRFALKDVYELSNLSKDSTLEDFPELFRKMDEVLKRANSIVEKELDVRLVKSRYTFLKNYALYTDYSHEFASKTKKKLSIHIGFEPKRVESDLPHFYIRLYIDPKYSIDNKNLIVNDLVIKGWIADVFIKKYELIDLLKEKNEHFLILQEWIKEAVEQLAAHKNLF